MKEVAVAQAEPGVVFWRPLDGTGWRKVYLRSHGGIPWKLKQN